MSDQARIMYFVAHQTAGATHLAALPFRSRLLEHVLTFPDSDAHLADKVASALTKYLRRRDDSDLVEDLEPLTRPTRDALWQFVAERCTLKVGEFHYHGPVQALGGHGGRNLKELERDVVAALDADLGVRITNRVTEILSAEHGDTWALLVTSANGVAPADINPRSWDLPADTAVRTHVTDDFGKAMGLANANHTKKKWVRVHSVESEGTVQFVIDVMAKPPPTQHTGSTNQ